jgi:hypothetical protein
MNRWLCLLTIGLLTVHGASADPMGRLFFSAPERAALDAARNAALAPAFEITDRATGKKAPVPEPHAPQPPVSLEGIITRERGPATLWLDGAPQEAEDAAGAGMPLRVTPKAVEISPGDGKPAVRVKPGQTFDPETGAVSETGAAPGAVP